MEAKSTLLPYKGKDVEVCLSQFKAKRDLFNGKNFKYTILIDRDERKFKMIYDFTDWRSFWEYRYVYLISCLEFYEKIYTNMYSMCGDYEAADS